MSTKTVTIGGDGGQVVITKTDDGDATMANVVATPASDRTVEVPVAIRHRDMPAGAAFTLGLIVGIILVLLVQRRRASRRHRPVDLDRRNDADQARMAADVAALARRTATLETIVTDPAQRTARAIDALR